MKLSKIILLGGFILVLLFPLINSYIGITKNINTEKRKNKEKPPISLTDLHNSLGKYDTYYKKNFSGRSFFFHSISNFKYNFFGTSVLPNKVIAGKDGFLFLGNENGNNIDEILGIKLFSEKDLNLIKKNINRNIKWLEKRGIKLYIAIAPNKSSVYKEKLPFKTKDVPTQLSQIYDMQEDINCPIIYMNPKDESDLSDSVLLYTPKNTHWNSLGSFLGYNKIINQIKIDFPQINELDINNYKISKVNSNSEDISLMLDLKINDEKIRLDKKNKNLRYQKFKNIETNKPLKVLFHGDSFSSRLVPYFKSQFKKPIFRRKPIIRKKLVEDIKPDIIIYEVVERNIERLRNILR